MAAAVVAMTGCETKKASGEPVEEEQDSLANVPIEELFLPDTAYQSVEALTFTTDHKDSLPHMMTTLDDLYEKTNDVRTFRKNLYRNADYHGTVSGNPTRIDVAWKFMTAEDHRATKLGTWGGGTGWSGQPLYVHWKPEDVQKFKQHSPALTADFNEEEVMVGSLCTNVYFLNFHTGKPSREPLCVENVLKGTMSLDPEYMNLYVGQGVPHVQNFGTLCIDLLKHEFKYLVSSNSGCWRGWNGFDSSAIVAGGYLFWCGENGTIYKFEREQGNAKVVSTFKYKVKGQAPGVESSLCVYRNYGFFSDNNGNIVCLNLNTMKPVWYYDNHDDSDGSILCRIEDGKPYLYAGCEVDKQGDQADWHFVKLNALDGSLVWEKTKLCKRLKIGTKYFDGGMYASPLMGSGDCEGMIFANICRNGLDKHQGELIALNIKDGSEVYATGYESWAWSSPVAYTNERGEMYIFTGDAVGNVYLIKGKTGEIIYKEKVANNFESSPIAVGNTAIVGSRGNGIYKFEIK